MELNDMYRRRADWRKRAANDAADLGDFHSATQVSAHMVALYDDLIAEREASQMRQIDRAIQTEERSEEYDRRHPYGRDGML